MIHCKFENGRISGNTELTIWAYCRICGPIKLKPLIAIFAEPTQNFFKIDCGYSITEDVTVTLTYLNPACLYHPLTMVITFVCLCFLLALL